MTILAFSGSTRCESFNQRLVAIAAEAAIQAGADVRLINLRDFPMPLFSEDMEKEPGTPESALAFKQLALAADGFLIASPEYNSTLTPALKNAIDWASREDSDNAMLAAFKDKPVALLSASPSGFGGARSLEQAERLFKNIGARVLEASFSLPKAHEAFDGAGALQDAEQTEQVAAVAQALVQALR